MERLFKGTLFDPKGEEEIKAEFRKKYIAYIVRLLDRMDIESLERMMDQAIDEVK